MFSIGPSNRTRAGQSEYDAYIKKSANDASCAFCSEDKVVVKDTFDLFRVLENRFKYDVWDDHKVLEHIMLVPKRHLTMIADMDEDEKKQYVDLLSRYESEGYTIYSRAPVDVTRSVDHLHTHLLKIGKSRAKGMIYIRQPHVVTYFFGK